MAGEVVTVSAYPVIGKDRSANICRAFLEGAGVARGELVFDGRLREGAAFFWGVNSTNRPVWDEVRRQARRFYYGDNSYFDATRGRHYRIATNRLQHHGVGKSDGARLKATGVEIQPWRAAGAHIVVCPQSDSFMADVVGYQGNWLEDVLRQLPRYTDREIRVRHWQSDKLKLAGTLEADLAGAHCLLTWSSAAAVTALLAGVPCIVQGQCAAATLSLHSIGDIEHPCTPDGREQWAAVLADNEWSIEEISSGLAWRSLSRDPWLI